MGNLRIGWGRREVSTMEPVSIPGQVHMRISQGIHDKLYVTALCVDGGEGQDTHCPRAGYGARVFRLRIIDVIGALYVLRHDDALWLAIRVCGPMWASVTTCVGEPQACVSALELRIEQRFQTE